MESVLHSRLATAQFDESSLCMVAGLSLHRQHAMLGTECRVGDALTMIPPVTGNGMSMAFESAEMAIDPLAKYSAGLIAWDRAQHLIAAALGRVVATGVVPTSRALVPAAPGRSLKTDLAGAFQTDALRTIPPSSLHAVLRISVRGTGGKDF